MSALENAIYAMRLPTVTVRMSGQLSEESARELAASFLAALPPSIVVDGKVIPIFDDAGDVAEWAWIAASPVPSRTQGESTIARLLDAAREVAE